MRHVMMITLSLLLCPALPGQQDSEQQGDRQELEARLAEAVGQERLDLLAELTEAHYKDDPSRAVAFGTEALELLTATPDDSRRIKVLLSLSRAGRRLGRLVNDILDYSRLTHKSLKLRRRPIDLRSLAEVVLTLQGPLAGSKDLELINAVPSDLPAADADEARLEQILHNLVGNAVKFTEEGKVEVSATTEEDQRPPEGGQTQRATKQLVVTVEDTDIGIAEDKRAVRAPRARGVGGHWHRPGVGQAHRRGPRRQGLGRVRRAGTWLDLLFHAVSVHPRRRRSVG